MHETNFVFGLSVYQLLLHVLKYVLPGNHCWVCTVWHIFFHSYECLYFGLKYLNCYSHELLFQVRKARNTVMHSSTYTLSQTELSHITSAIVDLLEDPKELKMTPSSQAALVKVREVSEIGTGRKTQLRYQNNHIPTSVTSQKNDTMIK